MKLTIQLRDEIHNLLEVAKSCSIDEVNAGIDHEQGIVCHLCLPFFYVGRIGQITTDNLRARSIHQSVIGGM